MSLNVMLEFCSTSNPDFEHCDHIITCILDAAKDSPSSLTIGGDIANLAQAAGNNIISRRIRFDDHNIHLSYMYSEMFLGPRVDHERFTNFAAMNSGISDHDTTMKVVFKITVNGKADSFMHAQFYKLQCSYRLIGNTLR